jgi:hypothetical protein
MVGFPELKRAGRGGHAGVAPERHLSIILEPGDSSHAHGQTWEDGELSLEQQAREIVLAIMLRGKERYRQAATGTYEWRINLKADTIERLRKEKEEAERKERERQAELERLQVERLLADADAFRKAREIRNYLDEARTANMATADPMAVDEFEAWARWALAQADRLDLVIRGAFRITSEEQAG